MSKSMPEDLDGEQESVKPSLVDFLYGELQVPETTSSLIVNAIIRSEMLLALVRAGIMTSEQVFAALDRAEQEVEDLCAGIAEHRADQHSAEILQRMKDNAKKATDTIREDITKGYLSRTQTAGQD